MVPFARQADGPILEIGRERLASSMEDVYAGRTLTPRQVERILKCSVKTVHRIFGRMPGIVPVGKASYLIPRSLFDEWMRTRMTQILGECPKPAIDHLKTGQR